MVVSKDPDVTASIANIKAFGYDRGLAERSTPGVYDIARLGLNYRMSEVSAAIGIEQLKKAGSFADRRKKNMARLRSNLADLPLELLPHADNRREHANYCLVARLSPGSENQRNDILRGLKAHGIGASVYYPVPLSLSKYYAERYVAKDDDFPNAKAIAHESLALPVGPHLDLADMDAIAEVLSDQLMES